LNSHRPIATILTSAVGLGTYIPALLIERQLRRRNCAADVEVLEDYYTPDHQRGHLAHKKAHHDNFALAQIANRMARDVSASLDGNRVTRLLDRWAGEGRRNFIVWSGFWLPVIERYRQMIGMRNLCVDHCRIDAEISASFKVHADLDATGNAIWLWHGAERKIVHEIPVTTAPPIAFEDRDLRLVVHGGGWGIGTYANAASELRQTGYAQDVVVESFDEPAGRRPGDRHFLLDPAWRPWMRDAAGEHAFPPMGEVVDDGPIEYRRNAEYHAFHDVIRGSKAIVSKPGGGTLIDSLASNTPVVLLEAYGDAEKRNAAVWEHLGFGISYRAWRDTGYDAAVLDRLHANLAARARTGIDYPRACAERLQLEEAREAV
jgi:hypothetical protein